jgi:hypothetical protein
LSINCGIAQSPDKSTIDTYQIENSNRVWGGAPGETVMRRADENALVVAAERRRARRARAGSRQHLAIVDLVIVDLLRDCPIAR